jgi:ribose 5-phosphate isomerase A
LRCISNIPFITDNGNYILDCYFKEIKNTSQLNITLNLIPGVVDNGLFVNMADAIIIGRSIGNVEILNKVSN